MRIKVKADGKKITRREKTREHHRKVSSIERYAKTPRQMAMLKVAKMHGYVHGGGWIYNATVDKYVDSYGAWVNDIQEDIMIPRDDLQKARNIVKRVYPTHEISIIVP